MAHGVKYRMLYKNTFGELQRVDFLVKDYGGDIEYVIPGANPFEISNNKDIAGDQLGSINPTKYKIEAVSSPRFNGFEFNSENYGDVLIAKYDHEDNLEAYGIITPFETQDKYEQFGSYVVSIGAECGLAYLKTIEYFDSENDTPYEGKSKLIDIIFRCLKKIPYPSQFNLKSVNSTKVQEGLVLVNEDEDYYQIATDNEVFQLTIYTYDTCYNVLAQCVGADCELYFSNGNWWIKNIPELGQLNSLISTYLPDGSIESRTQYNKLGKIISNTGDLRPLKNGISGNLFSQKDVVVRTKPGYLINYINDPNFSLYAEPFLLGWINAILFTPNIPNHTHGGGGTTSDPYFYQVNEAVYTPDLEGTDGQFIESLPFTYHPFGRLFDTSLTDPRDIQPVTLLVSGKVEIGTRIKALRLQLVATQKDTEPNKVWYYNNDGEWTLEPVIYFQEISQTQRKGDFSIELPVPGAYLPNPEVIPDFDSERPYDFSIRLFRAEADNRINTGESDTFSTYFVKYLQINVNKIPTLFKETIEAKDELYVVDKYSDRESKKTLEVKLGNKNTPFSYGSLYASVSSETALTGFYYYNDIVLPGFPGAPMSLHLAYGYLQVLGNRLQYIDIELFGKIELSDILNIDSVLYRIVNLEFNNRSGVSKVKAVELKYDSTVLIYNKNTAFLQGYVKPIDIGDLTIIQKGNALAKGDNFRFGIDSVGKKTFSVNDNLRISTIIPRDNLVSIGDIDEETITEILGRFGYRRGDFLGEITFDELTDDRTYTFPDADITINEWTDLTNVPDLVNSITPGPGLSSDVTTGEITLEVNVDNATIEIADDELRIKDSGVTTGKINDDAVIFSKLQNIGSMKVIGRTTAGTGDVSEVSILNENDFASNSPTALATQASIKAYVDETLETSILGTENKLAKFGEDGHSIVDSLIVDDGEQVTIGEESTVTQVGILSLGGGNALYRLHDPLSESDGSIFNTKYLFMPWGPIIAQGFNINDTFGIGVNEDGTKTNFSALNEIHFIRDTFFDENVIVPTVPTLDFHAVNKAYIDSAISGTENRLSKFGTDGHSLIDSIINDDGTIATINGVLGFGGNNLLYRNYIPDTEIDGLVLNTKSLFMPDGPVIAQGLYVNDIFGIGISDDGLKTNINALNEIHFAVDTTFDLNAIINTAPTLDSHVTNKIYVDSHLWEIPSIIGLEDTLEGLEEEIATKLDADHVSGTANYIPRFIDSDIIGNSVIYQGSGNIGINTIVPLYKLDVNGTGRFVNDVTFNANALIATAPTLGAHATNKTYVDGKEWEISAIIGLEDALEGTIKGAGSIGYIPRFTDTDLLDNSIINQVTGNIGIDIALPLYKLDVNGTVRISGEVNLEGNIRIDNSLGLDHQFIKYNGSSNEWAYLNTGELQDKNMIVMYEDIEGERGIRMYSDEDNQFAEAFIFSNPDTGIALALHGYAISSDEIKEFGLQLDNDGFLYHRKLDGSRKRLATIDMITGTGGGSGVYVPVSPITIVDKVISIATANGSQTGALSSTDWTNFNNKFTLPSGGEDGQLLKKSGDSVVWGDDEVGSGGISLPSGGEDGDMLVKDGSGLAWAEPSGITYEGTLPIEVEGNNISIAIAGPEATGALYYGDWIVFNNKVDDGEQLISGLTFLNKTYPSEDPTIATITFKLDTEETINEEDYAIIETDRIREGHSVNSLYIKGIGNMGIAILTEDENLSLTTSNGDLDIMAANGKLYINGFEWDWTGATTGKILSIIDTNKMGWVTP